MYSSMSDAKPLTVPALVQMKQQGERIATVTAYDATMASVVDAAGVDMVLVGDSLGMVVQGHDSTLGVTVDHIVYHCAAVRRGLHRAVLVADMPFMSFVSSERALDAAGRMLAEGGAQMVKLEGAGQVVDTTRRLVANGIPVCGHLGLTPQHVHAFGGYRVQAREEDSAKQLLQDAAALQDAGAALLVLECVPAELARQVTESLDIPTIGIGAGLDCDGQVLVLQDLLGLTAGHRPKFVRDFSQGKYPVKQAVENYVEAVRQGTFPAAAESYQ